MDVPPVALQYLVNGIAATPTTLRALVGGIPADDPRWDARLAADRFSLREMVAHLADWDDVFLARIERTLAEDHPFLESVDEGRLCQERAYSQQDALGNLDRLDGTRPGLAQALRAVGSQAWSRTAHREGVGDLTLLQLASMILGHDAYHLKQAADHRLAE